MKSALINQQQNDHLKEILRKERSDTSNMAQGIAPSHPEISHVASSRRLYRAVPRGNATQIII